MQEQAPKQEQLQLRKEDIKVEKDCPPSDSVINEEYRDILKYLDKCIDFWRGSNCSESKYYVDAYQSVRISLFGKTKPSGHHGIGGGR